MRNLQRDLLFALQPACKSAVFLRNTFIFLTHHLPFHKI